MTATQSGGTQYSAAPQQTQTISVTAAPQTITITSTAPGGAVVAGATYLATGTAPGGTVVVTSATPTVCTVSGNVASFASVGSCTLNFDQAGGGNYLVAPQVQQSFTVGKGTQSITFTSTAPGGAQVAGPTYNVTATAPGGTVTFLSNTLSVCTISGSNIVSFVAAGSCTIAAAQGGNGNYLAALSSFQTFNVAAGAQTVSITSTAPTAAAVSGTTYSPTATTTSGLVATLGTSTPTVCSFSGGVVSFLTTGTCIVTADQSGNANFIAAVQATQSFTVGKGSQVLSFTSTVPPGATVGGATYLPSATTTAPALTVVLGVSTPSVCTISAGIVTFVSAGSCTVTANQEGNTLYNAASQIVQSFPVAKGTQSVSFTSAAPSNALVGGATYTPSAASTAGLNATISVDLATASVCSISSGVVSFAFVGTCTLFANQPGTAAYFPAVQVSQSFGVGLTPQTITLTSTVPAGAVVGGSLYTPTGTASSGLAVVFAIDVSSAAVCSISAGVVSMIGAGTCVVQANQPGNSQYNAAPQLLQSFVIGKGSNVVTFTSTAPTGAAVAGPTYTATATSSRGLAVTRTIDPSSLGVCSINNAVVSFAAVGSCRVNADSSGSANFVAAEQVFQTFAVAKGAQTLTYATLAPTTAVVAGSAYVPTVTSSAGLAATISVVAASSSVCSIAAGSVTFQASGTCTLNAVQAGNTNYNAAPLATQAFAVGKGSQTVSFSSPAPTAAVVGGPTYTVTATSTSGLVVAFAIDPASVGICTIAGATVSFIGSGNCLVRGNQGGDLNYLAAAQQQQAFFVGKGAQTLSFTSPAPAVTAGGATYSAVAVSSVGLTPVTFGTSTPTICSVAAGAVSFTAVGTCTVTADQAGSADYVAATTITQSVTVTQGVQTVTFVSAPPSNDQVGDVYVVTATASSGLQVTVTVDPSTASICSISGTSVSLLAVGQCRLNADQGGSVDFAAAARVSQVFGVGLIQQTINIISSAPAAVVGGAPYTPTATGNRALCENVFFALQSLVIV